MASDVPPVVIEFKGNIEGIQQSIKTIEGDLKKLQTKTKEAGDSAKDLSAKTVAAGAVMANVFEKVAGEVFKFAGETINKFKEVGNEVRKMQRVIGGSAEDASRLRFAGEELGVSNDQLIMGFKMLSTHLAKNDKAAQELGITYRDSQGNILPMTTIMQNLSDRFSTMPAGVDRTALAVAAFGRSGLNMLPVLAKGKDGLKALYDESDKLGLTMSGKDLKAVKDYTEKQKLLKASIEGAQIAIGRALIPTLINIVKYIQSNVVPWIQHFVNGLTGKNGLGGALGKTNDSAHKWGERIRALIKFVKDFRYWIIVLGGALTTVFVAAKMITYVNEVITAFGLLRTALGLLRASWLGVAAAEAAAAIAEAFVDFGANIIAGAAVLAATGMVLYNIMNPDSNAPAPEQDPNAAKGITSSSRLAAARADGAYRSKLPKPKKSKATTPYDPFATTKPRLTAAQIELNKLQALQDRISNIGSRFAIAYAYKDTMTFDERLKVVRSFIKQAHEAVLAAEVEERKTRGTKAHHAAMVTLNKALKEQASLQKEANNVMAAAAKNAKEAATATAEVNRQQSMLNTTMTASNSWLAAQVRTAGVTSAQQGSFIEVPVIIDGQTVFRVVQKHSLLNDRRNVSNGLARSGSTIG